MGLRARRRVPEWGGSVTPVPPPPEAVPHTSNLVYAGVVTGTWAGVLSLLLYGLGRLLGVPFEVRLLGATDLVVLPWFVPLLLPMLAGIAAALLAALLLGRPGARSMVFWLGTAVAAVSLTGPLGQPDGVLWSTRVWLALMHVITWVLVVPQIARIVGDSEPGMYAERPPA